MPGVMEELVEIEIVECIRPLNYAEGVTLVERHNEETDCKDHRQSQNRRQRDRARRAHSQ